MIDFIAERCAPEKEAEIRREFDDPNSFASRFIRHWHEQARRVFDVDWVRLAAEGGLFDNAEEGEENA